MLVEKEIDIYAGLTKMRCKWCRSVLEKNVDTVNGRFAFLSHLQCQLSSGAGRKEGKTRLMNMNMQARIPMKHR